MANIDQIKNLQHLMPYLGEGVQAALEGVVRFLPRDSKILDTITLTSLGSAFTTSTGSPAVIDSGATSRPLAVIAESRGTAGYIRLFNLSTTVCVSDSAGSPPPAVVVPFATATGEVTAFSMHGDSWARYWTAGIVIHASTTGGGPVGIAVMTSPPRVHVLFHNT